MKRACTVFAVAMALASGLLSSSALAGVDEPGAGTILEEPAMDRLDVLRAPAGPLEKPVAFRLELGFGWSSLVVDPQVGQGMGGGLYLAWGLNHRFGVELTVFFSTNPYDGKLASLGSYGYAFMAGNITLGPIVQLTRPGSRFMVTFDLGLGAYVIPQVLQDMVWTFGISGGFTVGYRLARWFGFGIKLRYHLFHLGGPDFRDPNAFQNVGVVDRFEMPGYLAFYF